MADGLSETDVYLAAKAFLLRTGWALLAGQPPDGCDHLPVVEVKASNRVGIGSKGAFKPDLIAARREAILIIEAKPRESDADAEKLRTLLGDTTRTDALYRELVQRRLFVRKGLDISKDEFRGITFGALAHSGAMRQLDDLFLIHVSSRTGSAELLTPRTRTQALTALVSALR